MNRNSFPGIRPTFFEFFTTPKREVLKKNIRFAIFHITQGDFPWGY
jgi:hypothetical protein